MNDIDLLTVGLKYENDLSWKYAKLTPEYLRKIFKSLLEDDTITKITISKKEN